MLRLGPGRLNSIISHLLGECLIHGQCILHCDLVTCG